MNHPEPNSLSNPETWVDQHGDSLFRYALLRVRDSTLAEDLVQETLLAALRARQDFAGKSSERSWLIGILKHKIVDYLRRKNRERPASEIDSSEPILENLFDKNGHWQFKPGRWDTDPRKVIEQKEFWEVVRRCLSGLPSRLAEAFQLRELDHLRTEEICQVLDVTTTNLWVMLHRARMRLWQCLQANWFGAQHQFGGGGSG